jgi:hypothetical protein
VIYLAVHIRDYNRCEIARYNPQSMPKSRIAYVFALTVAASSAALCGGLAVLGSSAAQAPATATPLIAVDTAYITNTFEGEPAINVRVGPSTTTFPIPCGLLAYGERAIALGTTPAREWVQIEQASCPGGVGWVYAANVTLSGALRVVESPPTPTPLATATFDPTLVAAFQIEPTTARLATFTPPPPLALPTYTAAAARPASFPLGAAIIAVGGIGGLVLAVSYIGRR